jgi:hypothetical protein
MTSKVHKGEETYFNKQERDLTYNLVAQNLLVVVDVRGAVWGGSSQLYLVLEGSGPCSTRSRSAVAHWPYL